MSKVTSSKGISVANVAAMKGNNVCPSASKSNTSVTIAYLSTNSNTSMSVKRVLMKTS